MANELRSNTTSAFVVSGGGRALYRPRYGLALQQASRTPSAAFQPLLLAGALG